MESRDLSLATRAALQGATGSIGPAGPAGPAGTQGATGPSTIKAWALINPGPPSCATGLNVAACGKSPGIDGVIYSADTTRDDLLAAGCTINLSAAQSAPVTCYARIVDGGINNDSIDVIVRDWTLVEGMPNTWTVQGLTPDNITVWAF